MKPEDIEQAIRQVLATEKSALVLSDRLFSPGGLFNQLASTQAERERVARSSLFRQAQERFRRLQEQEAAEFARAVQKVAPTATQNGLVAKLERVES